MPDPSYQRETLGYDHVVAFELRGNTVEALLSVEGQLFVRVYPMFTVEPRYQRGPVFSGWRTARVWWFKRHGVALDRKAFV